MSARVRRSGLARLTIGPVWRNPGHAPFGAPSPSFRGTGKEAEYGQTPVPDLSPGSANYCPRSRLSSPPSAARAGTQYPQIQKFMRSSAKRSFSDYWVLAFAGTTAERPSLQDGSKNHHDFSMVASTLAIAPTTAHLCAMTPGARLAAAIEVIADIDARRRPAADALKDWGLAHRFAGSGDRAAIAGLVYDALRRKSSAAFVMGADTPRAVVLGMLRLERKLDGAAIARLAEDGRHAPGALTDDERMRVDAASLEGAPAWVAGDYPEWLDPNLARTFGDERAAEGAALASRAPLDLRVNTRKSERDAVAEMLAHLKPAPTRWSP